MLTHVYVPAASSILRTAAASTGDSPEDVGNNSPAGTYVRECAQVAEVLADTLLVNADTLHTRNLTRIAQTIATRLAPATLLGLAEVAADLGLHDTEVHIDRDGGFHTTPVLALRSAVVGIGTEVALDVLHECTVTAAETVTFPEERPVLEPVLLATTSLIDPLTEETKRIRYNAALNDGDSVGEHDTLSAHFDGPEVTVKCSCGWHRSFIGDAAAAHYVGTEHVRAALAE